MCNIKLNNLSPNLFQEAIKAVQENKVSEKTESLVSLASENGFTEDEKNFLAGLASNTNLETLKKMGDIPSQSLEIDFTEPGISFQVGKMVESTNKQSTDTLLATTLPNVKLEKSQTKMEYLTKIFDENIAVPLKNVKVGVKENIDEILIENKIKTVESKIKPADIINKITLGKIEKKISNPNDKAMFIKLYKASDSTIQNKLTSLLDGNISLSSKDSNGKSLIDNLEKMSLIKKNKSTGESVDGKSLLKEAINMLADDKNITQGDNGTCGAGSLENLMRDTQPSELVRIVKDLASDGKVILADNNIVSSMKLARNSLNFKETGRNQFDRIFQSAVMQRVALVGGDERAGIIKDGLKAIGLVDRNVPRELEYDIERDDGQAKAVSTGDSAADPYLLSMLTTRMLKGQASYRTDSVYDLLDIGGKDKLKALKKGSMVCYKTEGLTGGRHYVLLTDIKKNPSDNKTYVHFKNTADVNHTSMELSVFLKKLEFTISKK